MHLPWKRLIRFVASDGRTLRGEPIVSSPDFDLGLVREEDKLQARVVEGDDIYDENSVKVTEEVVTVKKLLGPLTAKDVPIIRCIGLNYAKHIREAGRTPPPFPSLFFKPSTTVQGHDVPVVIPKIAQDEQADYEGELCIVIGRDAKNVSEEEALDFVAAYTAGNDVSSRKLQREAAFAGKVPQWGFSKGFDTYAPLGPCLVSSELIKHPDKLHLTTTIDGEKRQDESTTLEKGSVIMTGTPGGVGAGLDPPKYLQPGTKMEVNISGIGTLRNTVEFAKS